MNGRTVMDVQATVGAEEADEDAMAELWAQRLGRWMGSNGRHIQSQLLVERWSGEDDAESFEAQTGDWRGGELRGVDRRRRQKGQQHRARDGGSTTEAAEGQSTTWWRRRAVPREAAIIGSYNW